MEVQAHQPAQTVVVVEDLAKADAPREAEIRMQSSCDDAFGALDFNPEFKFLQSNRPEQTNLKWSNVQYTIGEKVILNGLDGSVNSGDCCALMGPSGSGKTSLLNCLSGRVFTGGKKIVSGEFIMNDRFVEPKSIRANVAYVQQEDRIFPTATAREALEFSAKLRLPNGTTDEEREGIIDDLLDSLGLTHVQDTMVGSELIRGLSGGEKKRCAIGIELVTNPSFIFLDEPTSGLDSYGAFKVVKILQLLAEKGGCTILCTIHQPSSEIFNQFNKIYMLVQGNCMYNGPVENIPSVFESFGYPIPGRTNPADFIMLLAQTKPVEELPRHNPEAGSLTTQQGAEKGAEKGEIGTTKMINLRKPTAGVLVQSWELTKREFKAVKRDKAASIATIAVTTFLNILFGIIFLHAGDRNRSSYTVQSNFGALTMVFASAMFGSAQGPLMTIPDERAIFLREYNVAYSAIPYLVSKMLKELPEYFITSALSMLITYWLIGFNGNFILFVLELWMLSLASVSYAYVLGAAAHDAKQAQQMAPLVLVPQLLFTGFFISISQIPKWLQWVQYLCSLKYGLNLAIITEFSGCDTEDCLAIFSLNDVHDDLQWMYIVILLAIFAGFRALSLGVLIWRSKTFSY